MNPSNRPPIQRWLSVLLLGACALTASAQAAPVPEIESAVAGFRTQVAKDSATAAQSAEQLRTLAARHAGDPRLLAYAGAATARQASTTMLPWKKIGHAEDGLALIDKALALLKPEHEQPADGAAPVALETRLVAANTFLALPGFFNREARGEKLLDDVLRSPQLAGSPTEFRSAVFFLAGQHAAKGRRTDEARRYYEQVVALQALEAAKAKAALAELKDGRS